MKFHILFIEKKQNERLGNRQKILWNIVVYCDTIILLILQPLFGYSVRMVTVECLVVGHKCAQVKQIENRKEFFFKIQKFDLAASKCYTEVCLL